MLKILRVTHLYIGVFIAPALLFFAFTGALQTFSLHETTQGSDYKPAKWEVVLAQLHKKQTTTVPLRKPRPEAPKVDASKPDGSAPDMGRVGGKHRDEAAASAAPAVPVASAKPADVAAAPSVKPKSHLPMKIFFLLVSVGLFTSTLTGIYMAYKYQRNNALVTVLLVLGVVVPLVLLKF